MEIKSYIDQVVHQERNANQAILKIAMKVADEAGLKLEDITGYGRTKIVAQTRHLVCYVANQNGYTVSQIGRALGRDHTSVMNSIRNVKNRVGQVR